MLTMTDEECKEKLPEQFKEEIKPFHICAYGKDEKDPITKLEDDSCQIINLKGIYILCWIFKNGRHLFPLAAFFRIKLFMFNNSRETVEGLFLSTMF